MTTVTEYKDGTDTPATIMWFDCTAYAYVEKKVFLALEELQAGVITAYLPKVTFNGDHYTMQYSGYSLTVREEELHVLDEIVS